MWAKLFRRTPPPVIKPPECNCSITMGFAEHLKQENNILRQNLSSAKSSLAVAQFQLQNLQLACNNQKIK